MGEIVELDEYRRRRSDQVREKKALAQVLLYRASHILSGLGDSESRVAWIVEDCVQLLGQEEKAALPMDAEF